MSGVITMLYSRLSCHLQCNILKKDAFLFPLIEQSVIMSLGARRLRGTNPCSANMSLLFYTTLSEDDS